MTVQGEKKKMKLFGKGEESIVCTSYDPVTDTRMSQKIVFGGKSAGSQLGAGGVPENSGKILEILEAPVLHQQKKM